MRRACLVGTAAVVLSVGAAGTAGAAPASSHRLAARIAMSGHPNTASPARFTLSETVPSGDRSTSYRVTFGDTSAAVHGTTPPRSLTHRYRKPGRYVVALTVSDRRHVSLREHTTVLITAAPAAGGSATTSITPAPAPAPTPASTTPAPVAPASTAPVTTPAAPSTTPPAPLPSGPLTADILTEALAAQGVTASPAQLQETGLLALRITVPTHVDPPSWTASSTDPTAMTTASGWIVWSDGTEPTGLVLYAHGCCATPADLDEEAAAVAQPTGAVVVAMDYRDATDYAPDTAAEDSADALADVEAALPAVGEAVAYGVSEGGAVTGLLLEHHPGLVDDWVDDAGPVDLGLSAALWQKEIDDEGAEGPEIDTDQARTLLGLYAGAVGTPPDAGRLSDLSPIDHTALLAGSRLRQAFLIHATGDAVVDYQNAVELADDLAQADVPTHLLSLVPATGQAEMSSGYHMTPDATAAALTDVALALSGTPSAPGATAQTQVLSVPSASGLPG